MIQVAEVALPGVRPFVPAVPALENDMDVVVATGASQGWERSARL